MTDHCWHDTNIMFTSMPPQYEDYCCRCGKVRRRTYHALKAPGHGPYYRPTAFEPAGITYGPESATDPGPCVERAGSDGA